LPPEVIELNKPTVFHITHYKAGSQWIYAILNDIAPHRIILPQIESRHVTHQPIAKGMIYPCVYLPYYVFFNSVPPNDHRIFIIIRDLRDTLVSLYFSIKHSHQNIDMEQQKVRDILLALSVPDGLIYLMEHGFYISAEIQRSWLHNSTNDSGWPGALLIRYEDLVKDDLEGIQKIVSFCRLDISEDRLKSVVEKNSFEKRTGRKPGDEDIFSHQRKGLVGDWRHYFDRQVARQFISKFGHILIETGYEKDYNWVD